MWHLYYDHLPREGVCAWFCISIILYENLPFVSREVKEVKDKEEKLNGRKQGDNHCLG